MTDPMPRDKWQQLIETYNRELMAQFAAHTPDNGLHPSFPAEEAPQSEPVVDSAENPPLHETAELSDVGQLQIRITAENQAYPIVGAAVRVSHGTGDVKQLDYAGTTDENGATPLLSLPTKDRRLSLTPGNPAPFTTYTIEADAPGYFKTVFNHIPIYGGVTAIQDIRMIPLPERGDPNESLVYDTPAPSL